MSYLVQSVGPPETFTEFNEACLFVVEQFVRWDKLHPDKVFSIGARKLGDGLPD